MKTQQQILTTASIFGAIAVMIGAFGAHGLKGKISPEALNSFDTAVKYQFYHVFALMATGSFFARMAVKQLTWAAWCFAIGIVLFSGSIYGLATKELHGINLSAIGIITPIGGVFFIAGWTLLTMVFSKNPKP
jgi:uncharacterized membrane protein YgdD (TMEM256/DUF423 family)